MTGLTTVGIIGTGSFGRFAADKLAGLCRVVLVGRESTDQAWQDAAACDYVVLAVPYDAYKPTLQRLVPLLRPDTVLVDVCSVKTLPIAYLKEVMPKQPVLATHPLFGPESAKDSLAGHKVILCPLPGNQVIEDKAIAFLKSIGLDVAEMSPVEHDELMAELQGLTFFVARALDLYGVKGKDIMTPSYRRLLELAQLEEHHSPELFATIEMANPSAKDARERFVKLVNKLNDSLELEQSDGR